MSDDRGEPTEGAEEPPAPLTGATPTTRRRRFVLGAITLVIVAVAAVLVTTSVREPDGGGAASGSDLGSVDGIVLEAFDGEGEVALAVYAGRPLVVNFWASWCLFCIDEMPDFEQAFQDNDGQIAFLGVDLQDSHEQAVVLVEETGVTYDLAADPDGSVYARFDAFGMPTTLFVNEEGLILERIDGPITADQLRDRLERHFA